MLPGAGSQAGASHAFAQAAFLQEILFQARNLPVEQITRHLDQADDDIGADGGVGVFDAFAKCFVVGAGLAVEVAQAARVGMVRCPFGEATRAEEIAVILEEFFEAGAGYVRELDLGFLGSARGLAAFDDVLLARAGGLDHLVVGAVALGEEAVAEMDRGVIDNLGFLVGEEVFVAAVRGNE